MEEKKIPVKPQPTAQKKSIIKEKFHANKKKIFGGVLAMIMSLALLWVGVLLFNTALRPEPVAGFLPADRTIAVLTLNNNPVHNQYLNVKSILEKYPEYSVGAFIENNFPAQLKSSLGREVGFVLLHSKDDIDNIEKIYFAEISDTAGLNYKPEKLYNNNDFYQTLIGDMIFFGKDRAAIDNLIVFNKSDDEALSSTQGYKSVDGNVPFANAAFLYLNFDQINDNFLKQFSFFTQKGISLEGITPLIKLFRAEGFALIALEDDLKVESFLALDREKISGSKYINFKSAYHANLANYVSENALAFWGGENLENQLKRMIEVISGGDQAAVLIFDNFLDNQSKQYFGPNVDLQKDLLALLQNEFAFAIEHDDGKAFYKVLIELNDPKNDALKIQEIANNFVQVGGFFEPKIVEHTLQDGTKSREIIANPEEIVKNESEYMGRTIYELKIGNQGWGIYYTLIGDVAILANHIDGVKSSIDIEAAQAKSLRSSKYFVYNLDPVLKNSDEISFFNFSGLMPILFKDQSYPKIFNIIDSLSSGRNYSVSGIGSIDYLHIK